MSKLTYKTVERYDPNWFDSSSVNTMEHYDALMRRVLKGEVSSEGRGPMRYQVLQHDTFISQTDWMRMEVQDDNIYRIGIFPDGVDVMCFGLANVDSHIDGHYDLSDDLPNWVKERLAVLMITSGTPPTQEVAGVGRRISNHVYWVYAPDTVS